MAGKVGTDSWWCSRAREGLYRAEVARSTAAVAEVDRRRRPLLPLFSRAVFVAEVLESWRATVRTCLRHMQCRGGCGAAGRSLQILQSTPAKLDSKGEVLLLR